MFIESRLPAVIEQKEQDTLLRQVSAGGYTSMSFTLSEVVPWGRSYDEYVAMFSLTPADLAGRILGCGDGPSAFNSTLSKQGGSVVSVDPIYRFSVRNIHNRIRDTAGAVLAQTRKNKDAFVWETIPTVEELGRRRQAAMDSFLQDFAQGKADGRYVAGSLPRLPLRDRVFDIALCSHLLFLYSAQFSGQFHLAAIRELCRVAAQVRIFPILELNAKKSRHLEPAIDGLAKEGYGTAIQKVPYQFQKGGNEMLLVTSSGHRNERNRHAFP